MQVDFHYYCIGVLARAAGFSSEDGLTIAYASQYVDDSTESELIRLEDGSLKFDPVRSSYVGLDSLSWSTQKRVYIPFHFIPPERFQPGDSTSFSFVTKPDSPFSKWILGQAASDASGNDKYRLCRIGVALHTYADTWAHQNFSGRWDRDENDVGTIQVYKKESDKLELLTIENLIFDILPWLGHAEAGYFPDLTYQKWKYASRQSSDIERDNTTEFLKAAKAIYDALRKMSKSSNPLLSWRELKPRIRARLESGPEEGANLQDRLTLPAYRAYHALDVKKRCENWQKDFRELFEPEPNKFSYDPEQWRLDALEGDTDWDDYTERDWDRALPYELKEDFWDSSWVHFHRAALKQRHIVLENLP